MEALLDKRNGPAASSAVYEEPEPRSAFPVTKLTGDAALLYPHVVGIVSRLVSRQGMDRPAADRMDASILLEKFITASASSISSTDFIESLASDLELAEGTTEGEALVGLSRFRGRKEELRQISWRSFVMIFPSLRASGFNNLSAVSEVLEI